MADHADISPMPSLRTMLLFGVLIVMAAGGSHWLFGRYTVFFASALIGGNWALICWGLWLPILTGQRSSVFLVYPVLTIALAPLTWLMLTGPYQWGAALGCAFVSLWYLQRAARAGLAHGRG